ncbi:MAG: IclR family transcriptional regulator [Propionibacteriales bacterium]|nr:IclR family transcriptional regulator [Propionibacteriales bacterium]
MATPSPRDQEAQPLTTTGTQSIDRAAELLSRVVLADEPPGFGDLVNETGLAKSTASRLLLALERHRLVHRDDSGGYAAGPLFALYASRREPLDELVQLAQPTLEKISAATGETVNLAVVRGNAVVQIAQVDSTFLLATTNWVDVDVPPHCSALGKVFFAAGVLPLPVEPMQRRTPHTITSIAALQRQLERINAQGYAEALGELEIGLDAVAAPVLGRDSTVVAAVGVSGPSGRINNQLPQLGSLLTSHTEALSGVLGYRKRKDVAV